MRRAAVVAVALLALAGCGGNASHGLPEAPASSPPEAETSSTPPATRSPTPPATQPTRASGARDSVSKVLVFVVENHSLQEMQESMPRLFALARDYAYATDYHAITHPSLPNYLVMTSGSMQGVRDDEPPAAHPLRRPSIFGRALADGHTAATYADSMPAPCHLQDAGHYYVRHNPWTYFVTERGACRRYDQPVARLASDTEAGTLPDVGLVAPDACHDAHDCPLPAADDWITGQIDAVMRGPDWRSGRLAIVVTADEDDQSAGNNVLTLVLNPSLHGRVVTAPLDHYSLYGLYEDALGLPHDEDHRSPSMADAFHLPLAGH